MRVSWDDRTRGRGNSLQDRRRRGYSVRYTGDDVVYDARTGTSKPLLCDTLSNGDPLDSERYPVVRGSLR